MKHILLSHLRFHAERYEKDAISEREFVQTVLDLAIERIVDLDKGRDDDSITGSFSRAEFASMLVDEEMLAHKPSLPVPHDLTSPSGSIEIDLTAEALEDTEDNDPPAPVCPRISCTPMPFKGVDSVVSIPKSAALPKSITTEAGDSFSIK